jgi:hypothetical protein
MYQVGVSEVSSPYPGLAAYVAKISDDDLAAYVSEVTSGLAKSNDDLVDLSRRLTPGPRALPPPTAEEKLEANGHVASPEGGAEVAPEMLADASEARRRPFRMVTEYDNLTNGWMADQLRPPDLLTWAEMRLATMVREPATPRPRTRDLSSKTEAKAEAPPKAPRLDFGRSLDDG